MRAPFIVSLAIMAGHSAAAAEAPSGRYECVYQGSWGCSPGPDGVCLDSGRVRRGGPVLDVDFDTSRIRLNGLNGRLEADANGIDYQVQWQVGGMGHPKLRSSIERGRRVVSLTHIFPSGSSSIGVFRCRP